MDRSKEPIPGHALKVSVRNRNRQQQHVFSSEQPSFMKTLLNADDTVCLRSVTVVIYLVPATAPSFFPRGSSSSTPHQSPLAKSVSPRNRTTPAFVPPTFTKKEKQESWGGTSYCHHNSYKKNPCMLKHLHPPTDTRHFGPKNNVR